MLNVCWTKSETLYSLRDLPCTLLFVPKCRQVHSAGSKHSFGPLLDRVTLIVYTSPELHWILCTFRVLFAWALVQEEPLHGGSIVFNILKYSKMLPSIRAYKRNVKYLMWGNLCITSTIHYVLRLQFLFWSIVVSSFTKFQWKLRTSVNQ